MKELKINERYNKSGIYAIVNTWNGKMYIGSSVNISKRRGDHLRELNENKHHSSALQHSWNKYPENYFKFYILEKCSRCELLNKEKYYLDVLCSAQKPSKIFKEYSYNIIKNPTRPSHHPSGSVLKLDLSCNILAEYENITLAAEIENIKRSAIYNSIYEKRLRNGFFWCKKSNFKSFYSKNFEMSICQLDKELNIIKRFKNCHEIKRQLGYHNVVIYNKCRGKTKCNEFKNSFWCYQKDLENFTPHPIKFKK